MKRAVLTALLLVTLMVGLSGNALGATKLVFMGWTGTTESQIYEAVIDLFEAEHPGVDVEVLYVPSAEFTNRLMAMIAGGITPDVFYVPLDQFANWAAAGGILLDLTPYIRQDKDSPTQTIWPAGINLYRFDGKRPGTGNSILALPKDLGPWAMVYNIDLYDQAGVKTPAADRPILWPEAVSLWRKLTHDRNGDGSIDIWGMAGWPLGFPIEGAIWSNGADYFNADLTRLGVDTPQFAEAVQWVANLSLVEKVATPPNSDNWNWWLQGKIATFYMGPWDQAFFWNNLKFKWDIAPWPASPRTGQSRTWVGSMGIGVSATTTHPQLAYELVKYLTMDKTAQTKLYEMGQMVPNRIDLLADFLQMKKPPYNRMVFIDIITKYGRVQPWYYTKDDSWWGVLDGELFPQVYRGEALATQLFSGQAQRLQAIFARNLQ
ncbi:MAG: ABC transporter substrate-binding protein [Bacteroidota bacterium]